MMILCNSSIIGNHIREDKTRHILQEELVSNFMVKKWTHVHMLVRVFIGKGMYVRTKTGQNRANRVKTVKHRLYQKTGTVVNINIKIRVIVL